VNEQIGIRYNNLETMFGNIGKNDFTNIINQNHINDFSAFITNLKNEFNAFVQNKKITETIYNTDDAVGNQQYNSPKIGREIISPSVTNKKNLIRDQKSYFSGKI